MTSRLARVLFLLSIVFTTLAGCAHQQVTRGAEVGSPRLIVAIDRGLHEGLPEERAIQRGIVAERIGDELERRFSRSGFETHIIETDNGEAASDFRPRTFLLQIRLRRYLPGNARDRVVGQLFGVGGPDAEDAAMVRIAYQVRDGEGRLLRSATAMASSRHSWQRAVDDVCRETVDEVSRAIRELDEQ